MCGLCDRRCGTERQRGQYRGEVREPSGKLRKAIRGTVHKLRVPCAVSVQFLTLFLAPFYAHTSLVVSRKRSAFEELRNFLGKCTQNRGTDYARDLFGEPQETLRECVVNCVDLCAQCVRM